MAAYNYDLQLYQASFNDKEFSSANNLSAALQTESDWLAPIVTYAFGSNQNFSRMNFPLTFVTEGMGNTMSVNSVDLSYRWPVLGRPQKSSTIALTSTTPQAGRGWGQFQVAFRDRFFFKSQSVYTPSDLELRVIKNPERKAGSEYWWYTFEIITSKSTIFVPASDLKAGVRWGGGIAKVGKERSRGVEHRSYNPFIMTNQLSVARSTYKFAGNVKNKVMVLEIKLDNQVMKYWVQWELFMKMLYWKEACETDLWESKYNKDSEGIIHNRDTDSDEVVSSGAGMKEQIPNSDTYVNMTTEKLESIITDLLFNASDADTVDIEFYTGTGGLREASRAMENKARAFTLVDTNVTDTATMSGRSVHGKELAFGAIFTTYRSQDGHRITFKKLPLLDKGVKAEISPLNSLDSLPRESYNMYAIDNSVYDGENNLIYASEGGREDIQYIVAGAASIPGHTDPLFRASDLDASSIEKIKTQGIAMRRAANSVKIFNRR